jgi:hypothetical protein
MIEVFTQSLVLSSSAIVGVVIGIIFLIAYSCIYDLVRTGKTPKQLGYETGFDSEEIRELAGMLGIAFVWIFSISFFIMSIAYWGSL